MADLQECRQDECICNIASPHHPTATSATLHLRSPELQSWKCKVAELQRWRCGVAEMQNCRGGGGGMPSRRVAAVPPLHVCSPEMQGCGGGAAESQVCHSILHLCTPDPCNFAMLQFWVEVQKWRAEWQIAGLQTRRAHRDSATLHRHL